MKRWGEIFSLTPRVYSSDASKVKYSIKCDLKVMTRVARFFKLGGFPFSSFLFVLYHMHVSFPRETIRIYSDHTQPVVFAISKMVQVNHMNPQCPLICANLSVSTVVRAQTHTYPLLSQTTPITPFRKNKIIDANSWFCFTATRYSKVCYR